MGLETHFSDSNSFYNFKTKKAENLQKFFITRTIFKTKITFFFFKLFDKKVLKKVYFGNLLGNLPPHEIGF